MIMTLEVFFDYACPFCLRGHEYLTELLPRYPGLTIDWRPCEAHPRPENYSPHSDLLARGMHIARESGADLSLYHPLAYDAALLGAIDIEDAKAVSGFMGGLTERDAFCKALLDGAYADTLFESNRLAWEEYDFAAVPSYRAGVSLLGAAEGVGVTRDQLAVFLDEAFAGGRLQAREE